MVESYGEKALISLKSPVSATTRVFYFNEVKVSNLIFLRISSSIYINYKIKIYLKLIT